MNLAKTLLAPVMLGLAIMSTGAAAETHGEHGKSGIEVKQAWVRAVPPTSKMSAAYMELHNMSGDDDHLVSAESNVAEAVELHNVRKKESMMEMYQVKSIGIPAGGSQALKPGSYHVMLIGLKQPLKEGDEVELTLNFMHAGAMTIKAPVKEGGMAPMKHEMKH